MISAYKRLFTQRLLIRFVTILMITTFSIWLVGVFAPDDIAGKPFWFRFVVIFIMFGLCWRWSAELEK